MWEIRCADPLRHRVRSRVDSSRQHQCPGATLSRERPASGRVRTAARRTPHQGHTQAQIAPQRRPHYGPHERMAILELRAARGWSLKQTGDTFLVTPATIAGWVKRIDDQGADALLQLREPVNKFPDFVRYIVQRLRILCPTMGKVKIAKTLCRAGLHLGVTTVGRILKEEPQFDPGDAASSTRVVKAKRPNQNGTYLSSQAPRRRWSRIEFSHGIHRNHGNNDEKFPCLPRVPWLFT